MKTRCVDNRMRNVICGLGLVLAISASTGCQIVENGQTLPSPYYLHDDVQYFAPGSEFKLTNEAAALKAYRAEVEAAGR
jgi:hypothetical protein